LGLDHVSFAVADLAALQGWAARLDELGIPHSPLRDYGYAHAITFNDPDGIPLEFFWQKPRG
jgi:glyoxylase I family protein